MKPRNPYVALARFRKAGKHKKKEVRQKKVRESDLDFLS